MNAIKKPTKLQQDLIDKVAKDERFKNYQIKINSGSMRGDGYMGTIYTVQIKNDHRKLDLILKTAMDSDELRKQAPIDKAYEREIEMYSTIFPLFNNLVSTVNVDITSNFNELVAKCYGFLNDEKNECILLENLKESGYKLWDRRIPMNSDHINLILQIYGRLHAYSQILRHNQPEIYRTFEDKLVNIYYYSTEEQTKEMFFGIMKSLIKVVEDDEKIRNRLEQFSEELPEFFLGDMKKKDKLSVIGHGDCWCNNMLFKYEDSTNPAKPTKACLLDWQLSHISSPVCDLSYFFYCTASKNLLNDLKKFLKAYYNTFSSTLKQFGFDPNEIMTFQELEDEWKSKSKYGMLIGTFIIKIMLTESSKALDLVEIADSGEDIIKAMHYDIVNEEEYNKRLSSIIYFMAENGYL